MESKTCMVMNTLRKLARQIEPQQLHSRRLGDDVEQSGVYKKNGANDYEGTSHFVTQTHTHFHHYRQSARA